VQAIDRLASDDATSEESLHRTILADEYIRGHSTARIMARYAISESPFHLHRRDAIHAVGQDVIAREQALAAGDLQTIRCFEHFAAAAQTYAVTTDTVTLLISHRFSTVRMADMIVVISNGTIAEHGTHDDLVARHGIYAEVYNLQVSGYA
jgi:hypothetical protein